MNDAETRASASLIKIWRRRQERMLRGSATAARGPPNRRAAARPLSVRLVHALGNGTATNRSPSAV
jgi:hypothetical protein